MKIRQDTLIAVFSRRFRVYFVQKSTFESRENTTWALPFYPCHYVSVTSWTRPVWVDEMHILIHGPTFFCSSWLKSQPSWLLPEELKCEFFFKRRKKRATGAKDIDRTTARNLHVKISSHFLSFQALLRLRLRSPLKHATEKTWLGMRTRITWQ